MHIMQYAVIFKGCKNDNFKMKKLDIFLIKKIMYIPVNPIFTFFCEDLIMKIFLRSLIQEE